MKSKPASTLIILLGATILASCAFPGSTTPTQTIDAKGIMTAAAATAFVRLTDTAAQSTATPPATQTETPMPVASVIIRPTSIATIEPIQAVVGANSNVRSLPFKDKTNDIGGLLLGQPVKVIARNDDATWLYILYADSPTGTGWIIARAVPIGEQMGKLPIVIFPDGENGAPLMIPPFSYQITGTPLPPSTPPADWSKYGTITQQANVRLGPSVGFMTIGVLDVGQKVTFRGRIAENAWVQIDYPSGPGGFGWVLASLVQANDGFGGLPYYDVLGTPVTPTPESSNAGSVTETTPVITPTQGSSLTVTAAPPSASGVNGEVTIQINVRSGPAQTFQSLGMLNPKDKVVITGLTINKYWYQIQYTKGTGGVGWVASQYIRVLGDMLKTPYFNNEGTQVPQ